jgi:hypothetical protein
MQTLRDSRIRVEPVSSLSEAAQRRFARQLAAMEKKRAGEDRALARQLRTLRSDYRRDLTVLMGPAGMRQYRDLREKLSKASRSVKIRDANALLNEIGVDRVRASRLQKAYLEAARKLLDHGDLSVPVRDRAPYDCDSPWVTYRPPYGGFFWSFEWERSDEASNPVLTRHLDRVTGRIGSAIGTKLSGADNDDFLTAVFYTALNTWHTALATGPLEGYLAFEFRTSTYSGDVNDEFGLSAATYSQFARARLRVVDGTEKADTKESLIFNVIDTVFGGDDFWNRVVAKPRDQHWYYFRTTESFDQEARSSRRPGSTTRAGSLPTTSALRRTMTLT